LYSVEEDARRDAGTLTGREKVARNISEKYKIYGNEIYIN
jgi:hypothetical protein